MAFAMHTYFVGTVPADYNYILAIAPQRTLNLDPYKDQKIVKKDGGGIDVIVYDDQAYFDIRPVWDKQLPDQAGLIVDLWVDPAKANGSARTFYYTHLDGHVYTVRFMAKPRLAYPSSPYQSIIGTVLRVEGNKPS